ncbi:T-lymphocyte activation antigen CD80 [Artibeus jamaicensis]|uniref:T-lymphocyte activation antigen CD80 n=1 Tax=Artibeus jamaicensis TaxID=9417 RepID=UPI00235A99AA|nr:T-lymphocyte activation antigen CD80 [Artibeus jamaicensis]XP_053519151.1 T-lymphocyte activation antigen CD80 [Artibeus jamaicensis]XP_053519152.1 T-lymphocyte activation antigen CD80 [Artibeus jamaicensis]XP_053519153.1 T-lymphocyte activation antigen CD80 [Artibeus jamaicensis]
MDQTLMWGTLLPKCSYLKCSYLFQLLVLAGLFYFCSGISQVVKRVKDTAVLPCDYNISADDLTKVRIYWQKKPKDVVLSVISGEAKVWPKYKNRTIPTITNNPSIVILALQLSDSGIYDCIIQKPEKGVFQMVHLKPVSLLVRADFPVPSITELGNPSTNIKRIICSTSGGSPKPHLSWLENGKELNAINTTVTQDPESELYTISSELDFNVTDNHSFMCLVKYGDLMVSHIFNWQKYEPTAPPFTDKPQTWTTTIASGLVPCAVLCAVVCVVILKCRPNGRRAARTHCERKDEESMEMETISPICSRHATVTE